MNKLIYLFATIIFCNIILTSYATGYDGAWCWFADPRAKYVRSSDGSVQLTYVGYIDKHGNVKALQYDHNRHSVEDVLIRSYFQPDDHNNPTFLALEDGRVMVFYSRHTDEPCFYYRITDSSSDLGTLSLEKIIPTDHNTTYPSPFLLSADPEHFYLCWRGINWHPTIARFTLPDSDGNVTCDWGPYQIVQSTGARPYAKYDSNGRDRILMAYTTGHPDNEDLNYVYFNYVDISDMSLRDVNATKVADIAVGPLQVSKDQSFVDSHPAMIVDSAPYRDWVWQVASNRQDSLPYPVIAMTRISPDKHSHNYYIARYDGQKWAKSHIAYGGGHFHQSPKIEHCYSGGMALDLHNPGTVYCSVPVYGCEGRMYEIVRYDVDDNGEVCGEHPCTANSTTNNVRPYVIDAPDDMPVGMIWMEGDYYDWIVSREHPEGYDTIIFAEGGEVYSPVVETVSANNVIDLNNDFVYGQHVEMDKLDSKGVVLKDGKLTYRVDPTTLIPTLTYGKKSYPSNNRLATSDSWTKQRRATDGRWHEPVPKEAFDLKLIYANGVLSIYIDGMLDQRVRLDK